MWCTSPPAVGGNRHLVTVPPPGVGWNRCAWGAMDMGGGGGQFENADALLLFPSIC